MEEASSQFSLPRILGNKKFLSFLLCVLLAAGIWVVNALNKTQQCTVDVSINYDQSWLKSWSSGDQPSKLTATLSGRGFDLANFLFKNHRLEVKINQEGLFNSNKELSSMDLVHSIFSKYLNTIYIDHISPAIITLPSRKSFFKKVAVKPKFDISLKPEFMISGPAVCVPDSVLLSSTNEFPDTLKTIFTITIKKEMVKNPVFSTALISIPENLNIIAEVKSVWMYIPVEEATEKVIETTLLPDFIHGGNVELVPSVVKLTCRVPISRYDQTTANRFLVVANVANDKQKQAVVSVKNAPFWADHISFKPATVDYFYRNP